MAAIEVRCVRDQAGVAALAVARRLKPDLDEEEFMRRLEAQWPLAFFPELRMTLHAHGNSLVIAVNSDPTFRDWGEKVVSEALGGGNLFDGNE